MKFTKIVCTIGPASQSKTMLGKLIKAGMNVARLNFSHGTAAQHAALIRSVRSASLAAKQPVAILVDLQGPRIRIGDMGDATRMLKKNENVVFTTNPVKAGDTRIPVTYANLHKEMKVGERMLLVDGLIVVHVTKISGHDIHGVVKLGGLIATHKGINLPDTQLSIPSITDKDKEDVMLAVKQDADYIALSFVRSASDIVQLRRLIVSSEKKLKKNPISPLRIIAKIERREAIDRIDEIITEADGIMVARGDLGIEIDIEDVPLMQKMIIDKCVEHAKPVIVATQMLESMITNPRPTRAEVSDVANAVLDHTDAVMLSGESAMGKFPSESVQFMRLIIEKTESSNRQHFDISNIVEKHAKNDEVISQMAHLLADSVKARGIFVASLSGKSARIVSRYRPSLPIYVGCEDERTRHQLMLSWGIVPFILKPCKSLDELIRAGIAHLKKMKYVKNGDQIIMIAGEPVGKQGVVNLIEIKELK